MSAFQNEKQDKEKEKDEGKETPPEERKFDPSGYDHDLCEMLGECVENFFYTILQP